MSPSRGPIRWPQLSTLATVVTCWISCAAFRSPCRQYSPVRIHQSIHQSIPRHPHNPKRHVTKGTWQPGDVEKDFALLEQAIAFTNADQTLQQRERMETLNYFAQQRRPISPDLIRHVGKPLLFSFFGAALLKATHSHALGIGRLARCVSSLHFWCLVVLCPLVTYRAQLWTSSRLTDGVTQTPSIFTKMRDVENQATTTRNYVLCLLEQWTSVVAGCSALVAYRWFVDTNTPLQWLVQLIARGGVLASLHQYPKLWFALIRPEQPRPVPWSVCILQPLTSWLYTPWFVALDLALFTSSQVSLPWSNMGLFYASSIALTGLVAAWFRPNQQSRFVQWLGSVKRPPIRIMARAALLGWIFKRRQTIVHAVNTIGTLSAVEWIAYFPWRSVASYISIGLALIGPICHIWAALRLVRIQFTHGVSLAMDKEGFAWAIQNATSTGDPAVRQWRYTLTWREPERVGVTLTKWSRKVGYWLSVAGSVDDKLRREYMGRRRGETKTRGLTVLQRVAESRASRDDRDNWRQSAMDRVAKMHQDDYDLKTLNDPLGVAVQQTLGIGLGFNFEHWSDLSHDERPTTRRLQARAAKSAIRRVQDIYDPESARLELDAISDPARRHEKALELQLSTEQKVNHLANRLAELIPTDLALGRNNTARFQLYDLTSFKRTSTNEYVMSRDSSLGGLLKSQQQKPTSYDIDYLNPMGDSDVDDEFIEEWKRRYQNTTGDSTDSESEDQGDRTVLA